MEDVLLGMPSFKVIRFPVQKGKMADVNTMGHSSHMSQSDQGPWMLPYKFLPRNF